MANFYQTEAEEFQERIRRLVKLNEARQDYGQCAKIVPNGCAQANPDYSGQYNTALGICGAYIPPAYEPPKSDQEIYYRSIGVENQKLLQEKQRLVNQILMLQNELRIVKEENYNYKVKATKKKWNVDVAIYDFFTKVGVSISALYQDVVKWFNT
jgi:hypothetical protein